MQKWLKKTLLDDEHENEIDEMTSKMGLCRVGWIFTDWKMLQPER